MIVYLDVDGTLIDEFDNLRPFVIPFIQQTKNLGYYLVVWSGGGSDYARRHINRLGPHLVGLVDQYGSKIGSSGARPKVVSDHTKLFFVDDSEHFVDRMRKKGHGAYRVATYDANTMTGDTELMRAIQAMEEYDKG